MKSWKITVLTVVVTIILLTAYYPGIWLYLDNSGYPINHDRITFLLYSFSRAFSVDSAFGYDGSLIFSTRLINLVLVGLNQVHYILFSLAIFLLSSYVFIKDILQLDRKYSIFLSFMVVFNPISIYFLQQSGFIFAYAGLSIVLYSVIKYFSKSKFIYLLLSGLGFYFLLSYTRITGLYGLFLVIIGIYYSIFLKSIFLKKKKELIIFIFTHTLIFLPFLFAIIAPHINGDSYYFAGLGNYASSHITVGESLYFSFRDELFYNAILIKEITGNFAGIFQSSFIFGFFSIVFILGILIYSNFLNYRIKNGFVTYLSIFFLFLIFIRAGAKFLSQELFIDITYKYFPFIANNTNWLFVLYIPVLVYLLAFSIKSTKENLVKNIVVVLVVTYSFLSIYPLVTFYNNPKLQTINITEDLPKNYQFTFYRNSIERNSSLFFPQTSLYFSWSPYPFDIGNNTLYQTLLTNNSRLVNQKQSKLNNTINSIENTVYIGNNALFNLKNIFVFSDIRNPSPGQFDFFPAKDYIGESNNYYIQLIEDSSLYIKDDNESFTHFGINNDDSYEYFLYSPASILRQDMNSFFSGSIDITQKPIVIDPDSFHKPEIVDTYEVPDENKNISLQYKSAVLEPTKIYTKITDFDASKPFLLQLNQTFGMSWKVKWITKEEFEEKPCIDEYRQYPITQNAVCQYEATILDLRDTKYLDNPSVSEERHFEGNFVGNAWLVTPEDIPEDMRGQSELYAVIIYEKQIYYAWALVISGLTFLVLVVLSIREAIISYRRKKHE